MTIFDLVFLVGVLASAITLIAAAVAALRGRGAKAARILGVYGACAALYVVVSLSVVFLRPQRVHETLEPWCFDDWCLQVQKIDSTPVGAKVSYRIEFRIYSTARRVSQHAAGAWIYLIDEQHRLYPPNPDPSATPLTVDLGPLESVSTFRVFEVPAETQRLGLITGHPGRYCGPFGVLIIGQAGCLFDRPEMIQIE